MITLHHITKNEVSNKEFELEALYCCSDTGEMFLDSPTLLTRIELGRDVIVVSSKPLAPVPDKIYALYQTGVLAVFHDGSWYDIGIPLSHLTAENPHNIKLTHLGVTITADEINYLSGMKSNVQEQLNTKSPLIHSHNTYVNQNAFSNVTVGNVTIGADTPTDTLVLAAGDNVTLTTDETNDKITISAKDTTYNNASTTAAGLMSTTDKKKLDNIANGANAYTHPSYTAKENGLYKVTVDTSGHVSSTTAVAKDDITKLGIPAQDTTYEDATTEVAGLMSTEDKAKLDGIANGANAYTHPTYTAKTSGLYKVTVDTSGHVSTATAVTKADITALGIPAQDTTYATATTSAAGLMSATDKSKLDGIATGANKYTHPSYTAKENGLYKVTVDATGHVSGTSAVTKSDITKLGIPAQDTTYEDATTEVAGLMSTEDKAKLDGIDEGANKYTHPTHTAKSNGLYKVTVDGSGHVSSTTAVAKDDITKLGIPAQDTTYNNATTSTAGLMSTTDKSKLDGIASGAQVNQNAFSNVTVGGTTIAADSATDTLTLAAGTNITLTPDATNDKITITAKDTTYNTGNESTSGLTKLYGSTGTSTDGTMTRAAITTALGEKEEAGAAAAALAESKEYTNTRIADLVNAAPSTMDTLGEIAAAMEENAEVVEALEQAIGSKAAQTDLTSHVNNTNNPHKVTLSQLGVTSTAAELNKLNGATVTTSELNYLSGTTSNIQNQLDGKSPLIHSHNTYVNQNAFSNVVVSDITIGADTPTDTLTLVAGSNVTLTPDETNDKITIAAKDTTYSNATTSAAGLMSSTDKSKLDGIANGANAYTHPSYTAKTSGLYKVTVDSTGHVSAATAVSKTDITALGIPAQDTTYSAATTSTAGLMSADDKAKLDGIAEGANKYTHPTHTAKSNGLYKITVDGSGHVSAATAVTKADITGLGIPAQDTTYSAATTSANGLMSSTDKSKLNNIAAGAEVNQNAFSSVVVGETTISADSKTDTLTLAAGSNVTLTSDTTNDKITITAKDTTYSAATTSAAGLMSATDKSKLDGIASGANKYTHPSYTAKENGLYKVTVDSTGHVSAATAVSKTDITALGIPAQDTTYATATTSAAGLMSATDKSKLDGIATGAEVNQNAFSSVVVGETTIAADAKSDTLTLAAGTNITLTPDATNDKITITAKDTTYSAATTSAAGLMSATDKSKLDGIASGANKYTHPSYTAKTSGLYKVTVDSTGHVSAATAVTKADITGLGIPAQDTTYSAATTSTAGLMSTTDKSKLDGIANGANAYTHPSYTAKTSGLYKVTVDSTGHVSAATAVAKSDITGLGIPAQDTTYNNATTSTAGLMSTTDKSKLDGIANGANAYTHPSYTAKTGVPTANQTPGFGGTFSVSQPVSDATGHITAVNSRTITIPSATATTSAAGLMSAADKTKINGLKEPVTHTTSIGTTWTGSAAPYTQIITVTGITVSDNPIVDIVLSDTYDIAQTQLAEWGKIYRITTAANSITVYATEPTTSAISIQLKCI